VARDEVINQTFGDEPVGDVWRRLLVDFPRALAKFELGPVELRVTVWVPGWAHTFHRIHNLADGDPFEVQRCLFAGIHAEMLRAHAVRRTVPRARTVLDGVPNRGRGRVRGRRGSYGGEVMGQRDDSTDRPCECCGQPAETVTAAEDVNLCNACAAELGRVARLPEAQWKIVFESVRAARLRGQHPPPLYQNDIDEWWGGLAGLVCNRCSRPLDSAPLVRVAEEVPVELAKALRRRERGRRASQKEQDE
jgi:hypothetical protein